VRYGVHFWLTDAEGNVLLRRRPASGLLGGMLELPGTDWQGTPWTADAAFMAAPMPLPWRPAGQVRHGFTHFELVIDLFAAMTTRIVTDGLIVPRSALAEAALPSVMRKCVRMAAADPTPPSRTGRPA
jgi:A/G-specific adenine glycosylase